MSSSVNAVAINLTVQLMNAATTLGIQVDDPRLPVWNDAPGRTKDQVVAALRAAAERAS